MKELSYTTIDKSTWPDGPWQGEPDKMQFADEATGYPCLIKRNAVGALCGYVGVAEGHPAFMKDYDHELVIGLEVHGGLTYSDLGQHMDMPSKGICHLPEEGEPDTVWWLGFDCAHAWDYAPGWTSSIGRELDLGDDTAYRDVPFVRAECAKLAAQLSELRHPAIGFEA